MLTFLYENLWQKQSISKKSLYLKIQWNVLFDMHEECKYTNNLQNLKYLAKKKHFTKRN